MREARIREMLRVIESECAYTAGMTGRATLDERVMKAMEEVPRDEFVPPELKPAAFADNALPIGDGQTISQPFMVALMTDLLEPEKDDVILEVGTGSGYQAAILSTLVKKVYSIEVLPDLARKAAERLRRLGYTNVESLTGNGYLGLPEHAPFDGIIVTAAASHLPPPLVEQLKPGGRMVIPIGLPYMPQELMLVEKDEKGETRTRGVLGVAFVPLTGGGGETAGRNERNGWRKSSVGEEKKVIFPVRVECYAGYRGEETPRRFYIGRRRVEAADVIDRWLAPDHRYFKVRGDDGDVYLLRHDMETGGWELVMFERSEGSRTLGD